MCGRYALTLPPEAVRQLFAYEDRPNFPPRYNVAPTQPVPVVLRENHQRRFRLMRWGFLPGWVKDPKDFPLVINVRSETAREKPAFRAAMARRRCLMPADGFYEWHRVGKENRPYLFRRPDRGPFAFAAIHETYSSPDGGEIDTVALVNGPANGQMSAIHHRCPIVLDPADFDLWMDPGAEPRHVDALMKPPSDDLLEMVRIGTRVNKVANDGPELHEPWRPGMDEPPKAPARQPPADAAQAAPEVASEPAAKPARRKAAASGGGQGSLF